jgi:integrase
MERVLDYAKARGWREGENPARWRGHLSLMLSKPERLRRGHHKALPFAEVPAFMKRLREQAGLGARALEVLILTAARTQEATGMRWEEIDLAAAVWTVPAERMKLKREHRVPLSPRAVALLQERRAEALELVEGDETALPAFAWPGMKPGKPISTGTMERVLDRMKVAATVHGFRSSFRDWAGDRTTFPRELAELALAHAVGDETEQAYRRSDALEKRRPLMKAWADYCSGERGKVVPLKAGRPG